MEKRQSRPLFPAKPMRRKKNTRAVAVLVWGLLAFLLSQVALNLYLDQRRPEIFDPEYQTRLKALRRRISAAPDSRLLLLLGSSRTVMSFRPEVLAPLLDAAGKPIDRTSAFAWMRTWCEGREEETIRVAWPFPGQGVWTAMVPPHAWDSEDERVRVSSLLVEYNRNGNKLTPELTAKLDAITAERLKAHRFKVWVRLPVRRVLNRLFAPRDGFGMGTLPPLGLGPERERWIRADTVITLAGLLALLLVALDRNRRGIGLALFGWILLRAFVVTWLNPAPEPRYFLEFLPVFAAGAAVLPWRILEMVRNRSRAADARAG